MDHVENVGKYSEEMVDKEKHGSVSKGSHEVVNNFLIFDF
jgi:hypothetical protein